MLKIGDHIKGMYSNSGDEYIVKKIIVSNIFEVSLNDSTYILKWFDTDKYSHYDRAYYDNILNKCRMGSPCDNFLWPINITDYSEQGFGYLMKKIPEDYICITDWVLGRIQVSIQTLIRVALNLVYSLRSLGNLGLCGIDLHDGNIFFDPKTGEVVIADTDEIKPYGLRLSKYYRYGMKRYQAPETVLDNSIRNNLSDRHSLSIILFMLIYKAHPLEGKRTVGFLFSEDIKDDVYGKKPLFIFDPIDNSNAPYEPTSKYALSMWKLTPDYMKAKFESAFSQKALKNPSSRPIELEWLKCLARWDAEIEKCDNCGNDFTSAVETKNACPICGHMNSLKYYIEFEGKNYTVQAGNMIRRCLGNIMDNALLSPITTFISKSGNKQCIGIKNCGGDSWMCFNGEKKRILEPGRIIQIFDGLRVKTLFGTITIHEKKETGSLNSFSLQNSYLHTLDTTLAKIERKELLVIFVVDTSKSMEGSPIKLASHFIEDTLVTLQDYSDHQSDIEVKFSIMEFNTTVRWLTGNVPLSLNDEYECGYEYLEGGGVSDIAGAMRELNQKLQKNHFMSPVVAGRIPPIILFFTDGCEPFSFFGYDWKDELENIKGNPWFRNAVKLAILTSEVSDLSVLEMIVGTYEAILDAADVNYIEHLLHNHGVLIS